MSFQFNIFSILNYLNIVLQQFNNLNQALSYFSENLRSAFRVNDYDYASSLIVCGISTFLDQEIEKVNLTQLLYSKI
jgi:hypothetical protein